MRDIHASIHTLVVACFIGTWAILGILGFVVFYLGKDASFKRMWFPRFGFLVGALFILFAGMLTVLESRSWRSLGILVVVIPAVALITHLNVKFTKFCDKCGATVYDYNWLSPMRFCCKCGSKLDGDALMQ